MIRKALKKDISAIGKLLEQVGLIHHNGRPDIFKKSKKYSDYEIEQILCNEKTPVFVFVDQDGCVVGYAFCQLIERAQSGILTDIKTVYVDDLCVDEKARGKGIGRALYNHVVEFAREKGCYNLTLNVWTCNPDAVKFYEALGLTPQKIGMEKIL